MQGNCLLSSQLFLKGGRTGAGGGGVRGGIAYSLIALLKVALFLGNNSQKVIAP